MRNLLSHSQSCFFMLESSASQPLQQIPVPQDLDHEFEPNQHDIREMDKLIQFSRPKFTSLPTKEYPIPIEPVTSAIPYISGDTYLKLIRGDYHEHYFKVVTLDCRFSYEFVGGHINGAQNLLTRQQLQSIYSLNLTLQERKNFPRKAASDEGIATTNISPKKSICFVFHCEFSSSRGPAWALLFRSIDRDKNHPRYPELDFENVFILEGGYHKFYQEYPDFTTRGYQKMEGHPSYKKCQRQYDIEIGKFDRYSRTPHVSHNAQLDFPVTELRQLNFCSQPLH